MKAKRISKFRMQVLEIIIALGLLIYSTLGLMGFVGDSDIVNHLTGIFLGVQVARVIHIWLSPDKEAEQEQDITINGLLDEEPDDETLLEAINVMREELRKRGVLL